MAELERFAKRPVSEQSSAGPQDQRPGVYDRYRAHLRAQVALVVYALLVLAVLPVRPLWADELLQLTGARGGTWAALLHWAQVLPGGAPLPLALQKLSISAFGWSNFALRLPAALFGIGNAYVFSRLCGGQWKTLALFLTMPILFRYATEARMYSEALFFVLLCWWQRRLWARIAAAVCAVYSSPFALFPLLGISPVAAVVAAVSFLPWAYRQHTVQLAAGSMSGYLFSWKQLAPLLLLREYTGGGYFCGLVLLVMAVSQRKIKFLAPLAPAVAGPVAADCCFGYFFAARQWLFALPSLILLAGGASGWLVLLFVSGALVKDVRQTFFAAEDWGAAARVVHQQLGAEGCLIVVPQDQVSYYTFYDPTLGSRLCDGPRGVLVASPYTSVTEEQIALRAVRVIRRQTVGTIRISSFEKVQ